MVDLSVVRDGPVATVELNRPPANHFDDDLLRRLADTLDELAGHCRAVVLCSVGKHFCAGADLSGPDGASSVPDSARRVYAQAVRLVDSAVPIVAAVQGSAVGGGLGLACIADFRVATPQTRFVANFAKLGFHQGFGLTATLPDIIGPQAALEMFTTSARINGTRAHAIGLADRLVDDDELRATAQQFAAELAAAAPLAVASIRRTMRQDLVARFRTAIDHELAEQTRLAATADFREGVRASVERRPPIFTGQ